MAKPPLEAVAQAARWFFKHQGRRMVADTRAEIHAMAKRVADATGEPITVRPIVRPTARPAAKSTKSRARK